MKTELIWTAESRETLALLMEALFGCALSIRVFVVIFLWQFEPQHYDGKPIALTQDLFIELRSRLSTLNVNPNIGNARTYTRGDAVTGAVTTQ
jgi:hypothetical protein